MVMTSLLGNNRRALSKLVFSCRIGSQFKQFLGGFGHSGQCRTVQRRVSQVSCQVHRGPMFDKRHNVIHRPAPSRDVQWGVIHCTSLVG